LGLGVEVVKGDLFEALEALRDTGDLVVCNPPYISTGRLAKDRAYLIESEPRAAFDGGPYGFAVHQRVIKEAPRFLRPGGCLVLDPGEGQERQLGHLFARAGGYGDMRSYRDAHDVTRVIAAQRGRTDDGH